MTKEIENFFKCKRFVSEHKKWRWLYMPNSVILRAVLLHIAMLVNRLDIWLASLAFLAVTCFLHVFYRSRLQQVLIMTGNFMHQAWQLTDTVESFLDIILLHHFSRCYFSWRFTAGSLAPLNSPHGMKVVPQLDLTCGDHLTEKEEIGKQLNLKQKL